VSAAACKRAAAPGAARVEAAADSSSSISVSVPKLPRGCPDQERTPTVGIIIIAPKADPTQMLAAMRAGVTEWLAEPFAAKDLLAAIER
jgi:DNA-binding response OmpR family regulator